MRGAPTRGPALQVKPRIQDPLLVDLAKLVHEVGHTAERITLHISNLTRAGDSAAEVTLLHNEYRAFLQEFKKLAELAKELRTPVEEKIYALKQKGPIHFPEPIPASSLQTIVVLHLVGEQSIAKRLEELAEIRRRQKELLSQLEVGLKALRERFDEMTNRLNLFLHMHDCIEKDGVLPANIMYTTRLPQQVRSPFGVLEAANRVSLGTKHEEVAHAPRELHAAHNVEDEKKELEKRRALLLQLRQQAKEAKNLK